MVLIREVQSYIVHTVFHHFKLLNKFLPLTRGGGTIVGLLVEVASPAGRGGNNFLASQGLMEGRRVLVIIMRRVLCGRVVDDY